jgi:hypothetical protein
MSQTLLRKRTQFNISNYRLVCLQYRHATPLHLLGDLINHLKRSVFRCPSNHSPYHLISIHTLSVSQSRQGKGPTRTQFKMYKRKGKKQRHDLQIRESCDSIFHSLCINEHFVLSASLGKTQEKEKKTTRSVCKCMRWLSSQFRPPSE